MGPVLNHLTRPQLNSCTVYNSLITWYSQNWDPFAIYDPFFCFVHAWARPNLGANQWERGTVYAPHVDRYISKQARVAMLVPNNRCHHNSSSSSLPGYFAWLFFSFSFFFFPTLSLHRLPLPHFGSLFSVMYYEKIKPSYVYVLLLYFLARLIGLLRPVWFTCLGWSDRFWVKASSGNVCNNIF